MVLWLPYVVTDCLLGLFCFCFLQFQITFFTLILWLLIRYCDYFSTLLWYKMFPQYSCPRENTLLNEHGQVPLVPLNYKLIIEYQVDVSKRDSLKASRVSRKPGSYMRRLEMLCRAVQIFCQNFNVNKNTCCLLLPPASQIYLAIHIQRKEEDNFCPAKAPGLSRYGPETFTRWSALVRLGPNKGWNLAEVIRAKPVDNSGS